MQIIDWVILIPLILLAAAAFTSWHKGKNRGCHSQSCSACSRNPHTCHYSKENPNNKKRPEDQ